MKHNTQFFVEYFALDLIMNSDGMLVVYPFISCLFFFFLIGKITFFGLVGVWGLLGGTKFKILFISVT